MGKDGFNFEKLHDPRYDKDKESSFSYEEMEHKQRKLRLLKTTLKHREDFLNLRRNILEKIKVAGVAPEKIARDEKGIQEARESIAELRQREQKLKDEIEEHFGDYLGPEAALFDRPSPSKKDN